MKALDIQDVSICYITGDFKQIGLKQFVLRKLTGQYHETKFFADRHITFSLEKGDMLGIVGTNGAGKSTLLKAISGVMPPSEGKVVVNGRVAALLELTSGFDKELTVRENTFLRGALLGYTRKFMQEKYDDIIKFAELEDFQDRIFAQLSSGMKSRLAFSVACLVDPDIIILDEVLSVGDGAFKEKSGNKMRSILNKGVTGILVSHSVEQVRDLCNKVLWLDHGQQIAFGDASVICDAYEDFVATPRKKRVLPTSFEEIEQRSLYFRLYKKLAEEERRSGVNSELLENETKSAKEQRFMRMIMQMSEEEREEAINKYVKC